MAKKPKKTDEIIAEIMEAEKREVKGSKFFFIPRASYVENQTAGEFPLRTYEMVRNLFVGIN